MSCGITGTIKKVNLVVRLTVLLWSTVPKLFSLVAVVASNNRLFSLVDVAPKLNDGSELSVISIVFFLRFGKKITLVHVVKHRNDIKIQIVHPAINMARQVSGLNLRLLRRIVWLLRRGQTNRRYLSYRSR
jgi:hypothetical protein